MNDEGTKEMHNKNKCWVLKVRRCSINGWNDTKIGEHIKKNFIFHFALYAFFDMTNGLRIIRENGDFHHHLLL